MLYRVNKRILSTRLFRVHLIMGMIRIPEPKRVMVMAMVFNATFNHILVISWRSVLLVEDTRVPGENHRPAEVTDKLAHTVLLSTPRHYKRGSNSQL